MANSREAKYAWANYYEAESMIRQMKDDEKSMYEWLEQSFKSGKREFEPVLWRWASTFGITQKHFSEYMDGAKTHKGQAKRIVRKEDGSKEEQTYDAHITAEGVPYSEWKEGDSPKFYMKSYLVRPEYYMLDEATGYFVLNHEVRKRMRKGTLTAYLKKVNGEEQNTE